jgi:hypothetical protein
MPPSVIVKDYSARVWSEQVANPYSTMKRDAVWNLRYSMQVHLYEDAEWFYDLPEWQQHARRRGLSIIWSPLQVNEMNRRLSKFVKNIEVVRPLRLSDSESRKLLMKVVDITRECMAADLEYATKWKADHIDSSVSPPNPWCRFHNVRIYWKDLELTQDRLDRLLALSHESLDLLVDGFGLWLKHSFHRGARARIKGDVSITDEGIAYEGTIESSRIVAFLEIWTAMSILIVNHSKWYGDIVQWAAKEYGCPVDVRSPSISGYQAYRDVEDAVRDGAMIYQYDGSTWESFTAFILGDAFTPLMAYWRGYPQLASGIVFTSLFDLIAMIIVWSRHPPFRALIVSALFVIGLGDDWNIVTKVVCVDVTIFDFVELSLEDHEVWYVLGVSYKRVAEEDGPPVLCGLHATKDNAVDRINKDWGDYHSPLLISMTGKDNPRGREQIRTAYIEGYVAGKELISLFSEENFRKWYGPGGIVTNVLPE